MFQNTFIKSCQVINLGFKVLTQHFFSFNLYDFIFVRECADLSINKFFMPGEIWWFYKKIAENLPKFFSSLPGLLLSICSRLHEDGVFPQESFIAWEVSKDPAEQEGKGTTVPPPTSIVPFNFFLKFCCAGVAVMQLTSFFTDLRENEEEDFGSTTSDEA